MLVPMIDIFSVLVTFLLMTAVFSRITIIQLDLPSAAAGEPTEPTFRLEVMVRKEGLELTNGRETIAVTAAGERRLSLKQLTLMAANLKGQHVDVDTASVLMAPEVQYDNLIQVMDAIRSTDMPTATSSGFTGSPVSAAACRCSRRSPWETRHEAHESFPRPCEAAREDPELNLIPMIDIMSVLVAFLLVYSTEVEVVQNAKDVQIPMSTAEANNPRRWW